MRLENGILHIACPKEIDFADEQVQKVLKGLIEQALRHEARRILPQRLHQLASQHGFTYTGVKIFNSKSHWGSCTVCHTIEMNHSDRFWALMDKVTDGKAQTLRKELKEFHML